MLTAHPFQQDEACEDRRSAADGKVIAYPMELPAKLQKRLAGFKTAFYWSVVSITPHDFAVGQATVR